MRKPLHLSAFVLLLACAGSPQDLEQPDNFTFVRIRFSEFSTESGQEGGEPPWAHDYPRAEQNLLNFLRKATTVQTQPDSHVILDLDDPEIMKYPTIYVSEPGYWNCTEEETTNLRKYLDKGGFVIFDDFRDAPGEWSRFTRCMKEVYPDRELKELTIDHRVFHCFYDIETLDAYFGPK